MSIYSLAGEGMLSSDILTTVDPEGFIFMRDTVIMMIAKIKPANMKIFKGFSVTMLP
jgi:hypothetical protein